MTTSKYVQINSTHSLFRQSPLSSDILLILVTDNTAIEIYHPLRFLIFRRLVSPQVSKRRTSESSSLLLTRFVLKMSDTSQKCHLLCLPLEIRRQIYGYLLSTRGTKEYGLHKAPVRDIASLCLPVPNHVPGIQGKRVKRTISIPAWASIQSPASSTQHESSNQQGGRTYLVL